MSNEQQNPLTAEEILFKQVIGKIHSPLHERVIEAMEKFSQQENAQLRQELEQLKNDFLLKIGQLESSRSMLRNTKSELEQMKALLGKFDPKHPYTFAQLITHLR